MIGTPTINMRTFHRPFVLRAGAAALILILLWAIAIGPEPSTRITISPGELVRAVTIQRDSLIDLYLIERVDPNGRDTEGRTPLLIATAQQNWKTARRLVDAGAAVDLADKNGFTPIMAAAMDGDTEMFRLLVARSVNFHPEKPCMDGQDLLSFALDGGNQEIITPCCNVCRQNGIGQPADAARCPERCKSERRMKSGCCSVNMRCRQHPPGSTCPFLRMQSRATTHHCSGHS